MHSILLLMPLVALLGACETSVPRVPAPVSIAVTVRTSKPERRDVVRKLAVAASLEPWQEATVFAKVSGYLAEIPVDRGSIVDAGALIARLDVPEAKLDMAKVEAEMRKANAAVEQARVELRVQGRLAARVDAIRDEAPGAMSAQERDVAAGRVEAAQAALVAAQSQLGVLRAEVDRLRSLAGYAEITAPFRGVVTERLLDPGALVVAGTGGKATPLATIMDASRLRVMVDVPETDVAQAVVGNAATLTVDTFAGVVFAGRLARRSEALDVASRTMRVEVEVDNRDGRLMPGMFARVRLDLEVRKGVVALDPRSVRYQKDQAYVFIIGDGVAKRVNIGVGADDGRFIEVASGLTGDEAVVSSTSGTLADGSPVVIAAAPEHP